MYRGTKDILLPTTITGSLPRPSSHHMRNRLADRGMQLGLARPGISLFGKQKLDHLGGPRKAAGMRSENPLGAAFHVVAIST